MSATLDESMFSNFFSGDVNVPPGTGKAGDIEINVRNIELDGADSSITATVP